MDEENKQEYIQSHILYRKPLKLALKCCRQHDEIQINVSLTLDSEFILHSEA